MWFSIQYFYLQEMDLFVETFFNEKNTSKKYASVQSSFSHFAIDCNIFALLVNFVYT